jgi:hypothetical protein
VIYELRTYHAAPGKMRELQARFRDHTIGLFEKHGMKNIGYWTNRAGGRSDELIYMLAFEDMGHRERAWAAFAADPEWQQALAESDRDGVLNLYGENRLMAPTDFSPLK